MLLTTTFDGRKPGLSKNLINLSGGTKIEKIIQDKEKTEISMLLSKRQNDIQSSTIPTTDINNRRKISYEKKNCNKINSDLGGMKNTDSLETIEIAPAKQKERYDVAHYRKKKG